MTLNELLAIDRKEWYALSMPTDGVRFDKSMLELLDSDHDGRIRIDEVISAARAFEEKGVELDKTGLPEFLRNYLGMEDLYDPDKMAIFQLGTLRIDAKELQLCFHVADEEAHAALAAYSNCCILYLKLSRPAEEATRQICAVVTAGCVSGLYVGRNGVFQDRDGKDWEAVVTRVVEAEVSLVEAFWSPWRKMGEAIMGLIEKFVGEKQVKTPEQLAALAKAQPAATDNKTAAGANGAALASSVAAIGIGIGMIGAAAASITAVVARLAWWQSLIALGVIILAVSLPSVILTWFKLRKRDLGAILNASGWAINRPMRFSMRLARTFTRLR